MFNNPFKHFDSFREKPQHIVMVIRKRFAQIRFRNSCGHFTIYQVQKRFFLSLDILSSETSLKFTPLQCIESTGSFLRTPYKQQKRNRIKCSTISSIILQNHQSKQKSVYSNAHFQKTSLNSHKASFFLIQTEFPFHFLSHERLNTIENEVQLQSKKAERIFI